MNHHGEISVQVTSRHGHVSERMEEYATQKAMKLPRYNDQISRVEVVVDGPHEAPEVEMLVYVDNHPPVVARESAEHFGAAIDSLVSKLERRLRKEKEKLKNHKGDTRKVYPDEDPGTEPELGDTFEEPARKDLGT